MLTWGVNGKILKSGISRRVKRMKFGPGDPIGTICIGHIHVRAKEHKILGCLSLGWGHSINVFQNRAATQNRHPEDDMD